MAKPLPIPERISHALRQTNHRVVDLPSLAALVFPQEQFPHAFNSPTRGGPPGCYRPLLVALKRYGFEHWFDDRQRQYLVSTATPTKEQDK